MEKRVEKVIILKIEMIIYSENVQKKNLFFALWGSNEDVEMIFFHHEGSKDLVQV